MTKLATDIAAHRYKRHRFPAEVIAHAVWLYHRSPLSLRDVEDLLAERGIDVSFQTVSEWAVKFGRKFAHCAPFSRGCVRPGPRKPVKCGLTPAAPGYYPHFNQDYVWFEGNTMTKEDVGQIEVKPWVRKEFSTQWSQP
jgi:hypothetical protein